MNTNGKLFEAPKELLKVGQNSPRIDPKWQLKALDGIRRNLLTDLVSDKPATLLTVSCSSFVDPMVRSFRDPFLQSSLVQKCGLIDLRPIPSSLKYIMWAPFVKMSARKEEPVNLHQSYFVYRGGRELRSMLQTPNLFGGYVYILDKSGSVRWLASGTATEEELNYMFSAIKDLLH